jgi:hypothetical protein
MIFPSFPSEANTLFDLARTILYNLLLQKQHSVVFQIINTTLTSLDTRGGIIHVDNDSTDKQIGVTRGNKESNEQPIVWTATHILVPASNGCSIT